eukprot:TRINITY_DN10464_c0_g2_i7.p1 TRINITY_DN10464_c0_g2~~TRINITY_DN10464_c0_g2_i7.p1  ORF type:complete len:86 (+),score=9.01 TRINITY_DN10464_c0_g2_i7:70-327(+)
MDLVNKWETTKYPPIFTQIKEQWEKAKKPDPVVKIQLKEVSTRKPCFVLLNVLSQEECKLLINASEKLGFEKAEHYCFMYRDRYN